VQGPDRRYHCRCGKDNAKNPAYDGGSAAGTDKPLLNLIREEEEFE
jgi:hypothetical protein